MSGLTRRAAAILLVATIVAPAHAATTDAAGGFVDKLGQDTIAVLDRIGPDEAARRKAIAALLDEAVDLELIARLCLGRHWRTASEGERAEYVRLFRDNVLAVLARRMGFYTGGERFVVTATQPAGGGAMGSSEIIYASNDPPRRVEGRVRINGGAPVIIDVLPEGVSLVLTYRSEFDEVMARGGMEGLLQELRARAKSQARA